MDAAEKAGSCLQEAVAALEALGPWPGDARVALAFSGGADSVFLALAWQAFAAGREFRAEAWIVDHGHRPDSTADARAAAGLAQELGLPARILAPAPHHPPQPPRETALRELRYSLLGRAAAATGTGILLLGHQADDQAETVLLRILRGTGLRGLAGIPARRRGLPGAPEIELRRPLLGLRRADIRRALFALGRRWLEDASNQDPAASARARLRQEVLPLLGSVATGDPVRALLRLAGEAREWDAAREELLAGLPWRSLPAHLRRQAVAGELRRLGATVSPARLRDLEGALLRRGSARVDAATLLSVAGGHLHSRPAGSHR